MKLRIRPRALGIAAFSISFSTVLTQADVAQEFFTQRGTDPPIREVMASGDLPQGRNSTSGFKGSRISVEHSLLKTGPNARRRIPQDIMIHTLGHSFIPRDSFSNWSRWYQEDGNTQIFRLFEGEENVRNSREKAARIEAFSSLKWQRGEWQEWVGTYTIIKAHGAAIFQSKNDENDWSIQLNMSSDGSIRLNHRRGEDKVIARDMVGKPFHIRVRDNGHDYEVYLNGKLEGKGSYARPKGHTSFRWGMYLGGNEMQHDAMIFVTGAGLNPKNYQQELASEKDDDVPAPAKSETALPLPVEVPKGLPIPERLWTNSDGRTIRAAGIYKVNSTVVHLMIKGHWIPYSLEELSDQDRAELAKAALFFE